MKLLKYLAFTVIAVAGCNSFNKVEIRGPVILGNIPTTSTEQKEPELSSPAEEPLAASIPVPDTISEVLANKPWPVPESPIKAPIIVHKGCPAYKPPVLPPKPELPYKELERLRQGNKRDEADIVLLDHIDKLRLWGTAVEKVILDSQKKYASDCKRWQRATNS